MNRSDEANFHRDAVWKGNNLIFRRRVMASIESDAKWAGMYRVRMPDGHVTDMVNLTRAKDAAMVLALKALMKVHVGASSMRSFREAAE